MRIGWVLFDDPTTLTAEEGGDYLKRFVFDTRGVGVAGVRVDGGRSVVECTERRFLNDVVNGVVLIARAWPSRCCTPGVAMAMCACIIRPVAFARCLCACVRAQCVRACVCAWCVCVLSLIHI